jgi:Xaa-Pro aminopeptidase
MTIDDYAALVAHIDPAGDPTGYPLDRDFPREEYEFRIARARRWMAEAGLDALVVTSRGVGQWFTGRFEPHSWHDEVSARSAWFVLSQDVDCLVASPTNNHHLDAIRRSVWVSDLRALVERRSNPGWELWDLAQIPEVFASLGLGGGRLGFELGECMTLGMSVDEFLRLRDTMTAARLVDGSAVIRRLMSVHTPLEIERLRTACAAGVWIHDRLAEVLRPGMTERELVGTLSRDLLARYPAVEGYAYAQGGAWDVRNARTGESNRYHTQVTDRPYRADDVICRGNSGVSYRGYGADVDRVWHVGAPTPEVLRWYRASWECNRAMAATIRPGARCADVFAAHLRTADAHGMPAYKVGRMGHGYRNTGGLSVHPDNHTLLEPGMVISVEPMLGGDHGYFDLEDQYLVTETGAECLHEPAPERLPVIA